MRTILRRRTSVANARRRRERRNMRSEVLEPRLLLASDWQNPREPTDVDDSGETTLNDALNVIGMMRHVGGAHQLGPRPEGEQSNPRYVDVDGSGWITVGDALTVVIELRDELAIGEDPIDFPGNFVSHYLTQLPGMSPQTVPLTIDYSIGPEHIYEIGLFPIEADGSVGGVPPGDEGYAHTVMRHAERQVIYGDDAPLDRISMMLDPAIGGSHLGVYFLQEHIPSQDHANHIRVRDEGDTISVGWEESGGILQGGVDVGDRGYDDASLTFSVGQPVSLNSPPILVPIPDQAIDEGTELTVNPSASDPDLPNDTLTYTLVGDVPPGMMIDSAVGTLAWTPTEAQGPDEYEVTLQVTDSLGESDRRTFRITVQEVNQPPTLDPIDDWIIDASETVSFTATASDPDLPPQGLTYSLDPGAPSGATIDPQTGEFSWTTPSVAESQMVPFAVRVTDDGSPRLSDTESFTVTVNACSFDAMLSGWVASQSGGTDLGMGTVSAANCVATLTEGDSFSLTLSTTFDVPSDPSALSFRIADTSFDQSDSGFIRDAFEIALVDADGNPLVQNFTPGRDAFYNHTEGASPEFRGGIEVNGDTVTVGLGGIPAGTEATLIFRLVNDDTDTQTTASISDVEIIASTLQALSPQSLSTGETLRRMATQGSPTSGTAQVNSTTATSSEPIEVSAGQPFVPPQRVEVSELDAQVQWIADSFTELPGSNNFLSTPSVIDLTNDGIPEIVAISYTSLGSSAGIALRVLDSRTGNEIWSITDQEGYLFSRLSHPAVGDIDGDGRPEILVAESTGGIGHNSDSPRLLAFEHDGSLKWRSPNIWGGVGTGAPAIADLEGDQIPEVIVGGTVLNSADGTIRWEGQDFGGVGRGSGGFGPLSIAADLDLDGNLEIVAGRTAYRANGSVFWDTGTSDGFTAVGNFDQDRFPEVVLVSGGSVRLYEHDGSPIWGPVSIPGGGRGGAPTVADFDNDGQPEIGVAGTSRYVAFDSDGSVLWQRVTQDGSSNITGSSVFDFDGDGTAEVVYGDEEFVRIYRGYDGHTLFSFERSSSTGHELPVVADVDADGTTEIVFGAGFDSRFPTNGLESGLVVLGSETWEPTRQIWNQHSYHITNINDDGTIPHFEANSWEIYNNYRRNEQPTGTELGEPLLTARSPVGSAESGTLILLTGTAKAQGTRSNGQPNAIDQVTINGRAVDAIDAAGNFFARVTLQPGENRFQFTAFDRVGQSTTAELTLVGTDPLPPGAIDFSQFVDISGSFSGVYATTSLDEGVDILHVDLATSNDGTFAADVPLLVGVKNVSDPSVTVAGIDGVTLDGIPYYDFSDEIVGGKLDPAAVTSSRSIHFHVPNGHQFDYELVFLGQVNAAPEFTSIPELEGFSGESYAYDADATDPNPEDIPNLRYSLAVAPSGMTIDELTGEVVYPNAAEGNHDVTVSVTDGRGGTARQHYVLSVTAPPPNRPPLIVSVPVTEVEVRVFESSQSPFTPIELTPTDVGSDRVDVFSTLPTVDPATFGFTGPDVRRVNFDTTPDGIPISSGTNLGDLYSDLGVEFVNVPAASGVYGGPASAPNASFISSGTSEIRFTVPVIGVGFINTSPDMDFLEYYSPNGDLIFSTQDQVGLPLNFNIDRFVGARSNENQLIGSVRVVNNTGDLELDELIFEVPANPEGLGLYAYDVDAIDPDSDPVTYSLLNGPEDMRIDPVSGLITWAPTVDDLNVQQETPDPTLPVVPGYEARVYAEIADPTELTFDQLGNLYVGNGRDDGVTPGGGHSNVRRVTRDGSSIEDYGVSTINDPDSVLFDAIGSISGIPGAVLVGSGNSPGTSGVISAIALDQSVTTVFGPSNALGNVTAMTVDRSGRLLFINDTQQQLVVMEGGAFDPIISLPQRFFDFAVLANGDIVVSEADGTLRQYDRDGNLINNSYATGFTSGGQVRIAASDGGAWLSDLYALDNGTGELIRIDPQGNREVVGIGFDGAGDLEFGPDGSLYLSDFFGDRILRIAPNRETLGLDPNQHAVIVAAADGRGGVDTQRFVVTVLGEEDNHPPVIISDPITTFVPQKLNDPRITDVIQWIPNEGGNGHHYALTEEGLSWTEANTLAASLGGHLVSIGSEFESDFLEQTYLTGAQSSEDFWIGLTAPSGDWTDTANWQWTDGTGIGFENWRAGQPDLGNVTGQEDRYGVINFQGNGSTVWDNYPDSTFRMPRAIVEFSNGYQYDSHAIDPDSDTLTYSLIDGPDGMTVDPASGMVRWQPTSAQFNEAIAQFGIPLLTISLDLNDGTIGEPIDDFYASHGVHFENAVWSSRSTIGSTPPLDFTGANGQLFTNDDPIVLKFDESVSRVSLTALDVGENGARLDAYDNAGNLLDFDSYIGIDIGNTGLPDNTDQLEVHAAGIRRVELYQLSSPPPNDGLWWDNLSFDPVRFSGVDVKLRVADGRGGTDTQSYTIEVAASGTGEIRGTKFNDVDGNGMQLGVEIAAGPFSNPANGHIYYLLPESSLADAEQDAIKLGGHLVTIDDAQEDTFVFETFAPIAESLVSTTSATTSLWIGLNDIQNEGVYEWFDGSSSAYRNWASGQPQAGRSDEDGVGIFVNVEPGKWHDIYLDQPNSDVTFGVVEVEESFHEPGIQNWTIYLDQNNNGRRDVGERFTVTDSNGDYAFTGLPEGTYIVREEQQPGWVQTYPGERTPPNMWGVTGDINPAQLFRIGPSTGMGQLVFSESDEVLEALERDAGDTLLAISGDPNNQLLERTLVRIDPNSGEIIELGLFAGVSHIEGLAFLGNTLYGAVSLNSDSAAESLAILNVDDLTVDVIGAFGSGLTNVESLAFSPEGVLYGTDVNTGSLFTADIATGLGTIVGQLSEEIHALDFGGDGTLYGVSIGRSGSSELLTIDPADASIEIVGETGFRFVLGLVVDQGTAVGGAHLVRLPPQTTIDGIDFGNTLADPNNLPPEFTTDPVTIGTAGGTYRYNAEAFDPNSDPLTFDLRAAPDGMVVDADLGVVIWQPRFGDIGDHDVVLRVRDGRGGVDLQSFTITVSQANSPPVFVSAPKIQAIVDLPYQYNARAIDPDRDTVTYGLLQGPADLSIHASTGAVTWIPDTGDIGTHQVIIQATDGRGGETLHVYDLEVVATAPNDPPEFTSTPRETVRFGTTYVYDSDAIDPNADPLTYGLLDGPEGMTVDPVTGVVQWTPTASQLANQLVQLDFDDFLLGGGVNEINADINGTGASIDAFHSESLRATSDPNNPNNQVLVVDNETGKADILINFSTDVDFVSITFPRNQNSTLYSMTAYDHTGTPANIQGSGGILDSINTTDPATITIEAAGIRAIQLESSSSKTFIDDLVFRTGQANVEITVSDGRGGVDTQEFIVTVTTNESNRPPTITSNPVPTGVLSKQYSYNPVATDPDGDPLTYNLDAAPAGMAIDPQTGAIRWTPTLDQLGNNRVVLRVTDPLLASTTQTFDIAVRSTNLAPSIISVPPTTAAIGQPYRYGVIGRDVDGDRLTYSLAVAPTGMSIVPESGLIRWTPSPDQLGPHSVTVQVADGNGGIGTQRYTVEVTLEVANRVPVITTTPPVAAGVDEIYSYDVNALDPDGDPIEFTLLENPAGMTIDPASGLIEWTPAAGQIGSHFVTVAALDGTTGSTQRYSITVRANQPPVLSPVPNATVARGSTYRYNLRATDPEADPLTFSLIEFPSGMTVDALGRIEWSPAADQSGDHEVLARVADDRGATDTATFTLTIAADTIPPNVELGFPSNLFNVGTSATFQTRATDNVGVVSHVLTFGGEQVPLSAPNSSNIRNGLVEFTTPGLYELVATATDAAGNVGVSNSIEIRVFDPTDTDFPQVEIHSPAFNQQVSYLTDIVASVNDDNLEFWRLDFARTDLVDLVNFANDDPDWQLLSEGNTNVDNQNLATFDPTILANNSYAIRLTAQDINGLINTTGVIVDVVGNAKLGNFRLDFTDLSLPLAGIPIEVTRVYDTFDAADEGDFGYGWSLGVQDARILETSATGAGGAFNPGNNNFIPDQTKVYLTNPVGERVGFTYREQLVSASFFGGIWRPYFEADPGVYDTLTIDETQVARGGIVGALAQGINPNAYTLTTQSGLSYRYDQFDGLESITDLNGNVVTFSEAGIEHSSGESIEFVRDHRGRIREILVPDDNGGEPLSITYTYDAAGDLRTVTNQIDLTTRYEYRDDPAHYLDKAYDSFNRLTLEVAYEEGRFVGVFDGMGNQLDDRDYDLEANAAVIRDANGNATTLIYDDRGNVAFEFDPLYAGPALTLADYENMCASDESFANMTLRCYADPANPDLETKIIDRRGMITEREYDSRGNVRTITERGTAGEPLDPPVVTEFTYDSGNRVTSITNALNRETIFDYNAQGNLKKITNVLGDTSTFTYDTQGRRETFTDFNGNTTTFVYEGGCPCGSPDRVIFADGTYQEFDYNTYGQVTREASFEADGMLVELKTVKYDRAGRVIEEVTGANGDPDHPPTIVRSVYDGHLLDYEVIVHPDSLDGQGNLLESPATPVDQRLSRITDFEYDERDRLIRQIDAEGGVVEFRYDNNDNRILLQDPVGNITTWVYDELNRVSEERDPFYNEGLTIAEALAELENPSGADCETDTPAEHVRLSCYDGEGNQVKTIDRNGRLREFEYDHAGRLLEETWFAAGSGELVETITYSYDPLGNMLAATDSNSNYLYTYDALNRLKTSDNNPDGTLDVPHVILSYDYDAQGNVTLTQDNFGVTVESEYDERNRLRVRKWYDAEIPAGEEADVDHARVDFLYNAAGREARIDRYSDLTAMTRVGSTDRTYDLAGRSDSIFHAGAVDELISSYDYSYDFGGLVVGEVRDHQDDQYDQTISYEYDLTGQLTDAVFSGQADEHYEYDANGNRLFSRVGTEERSYTTDTANQLASDGEHRYEYDGEGNTIKRIDLTTGETRTFVYDHRNRLVRVDDWSSDPGDPENPSGGAVLVQSVEYGYDVFGRRNTTQVDPDGPNSQPATTKFFTYSGDNTWADFEGPTAVRFLFGTTMDSLIGQFSSSEGGVWHLTDALRSIRDVFDVDMSLDRREYGAFGNVVRDTIGLRSSFGFAGRELVHSTGQYYLRSRFYRADLGRFVSQDNLRFSSNDVNLYRYSLNSPANYVDPTGQNAIVSFALFVSPIVGLANAIVPVDCQGVNTAGEQLISFLAGNAVGPLVGISFVFGLVAGNLAGASLSLFLADLILDEAVDSIEGELCEDFRILGWFPE